MWKSFGFLFILCLSACGAEEGIDSVDIATMCVQSDLTNLCPLGTAPKLEAGGTSMCSTETDFSAAVDAMESNGSGNSQNESVCVGMGSCLIECSIIVECQNGFKTFTKEKIECN